MALDFLILYEHIVREYESIMLLKRELERRGYTAEIRQLLDRKKLKYLNGLKRKKIQKENFLNFVFNWSITALQC